MKKFMVLYHAPTSAAEKMSDVSPEDAKKGMEPWMAWAAKVGDALLDMGSPLGYGKSVTKNGTSESDKQVVGYSILQAANLEAAIKMLQDHPHLDWLDGCKVEVHEMMPLPGM